VQKLIVALFVLGVGVAAQPSVSGVSNAASFQQVFSPGCLVSVFGANFGSAPTVSIGGKAGFVIKGLSTPSQLLVELPVDLPTGQAALAVTAGGQTSNTVNLTIAAYAPAFFSPGSGIGLFQDAVTFKQITAANPATPGEPIAGTAVGLGVLTTPVATGVAASGADQITATGTVTVGGETAASPYIGASPGNVGIYQVNFTIPKDATGCAINVIITVGGIASPPVSVPIATPTPVICAAENSATGLVRDAVHGAAANAFTSIYVAAPAVAANGGNLFPGTDYQGIEASFNGTPLPLYSVTNIPPSQLLVNTIIPSEAGSTGSGTLTVKASNGSSQSYSIGLTPADVGVFRLPDPHNPARIQGIALIANTYWFAIPASLAASYNLPACTGLPLTMPCGQPAHPGDPIVVYFTGGGLATPNGNANGKPVPTGQVAPVDGSVIYNTVTIPTITIGGIPTIPAFSGIAPGTASEYQLNTTIPTGVTPGDDVPIVLTFGNSSDTFTIAVQKP